MVAFNFHFFFAMFLNSEFNILEMFGVLRMNWPFNQNWYINNNWPLNQNWCVNNNSPAVLDWSYWRLHMVWSSTTYLSGPKHSWDLSIFCRSPFFFYHCFESQASQLTSISVISNPSCISVQSGIHYLRCLGMWPQGWVGFLQRPKVKVNSMAWRGGTAHYCRGWFCVRHLLGTYY